MPPLSHYPYLESWRRTLLLRSILSKLDCMMKILTKCYKAYWHKLLHGNIMRCPFFCNTKNSIPSLNTSHSWFNSLTFTNHTPNHQHRSPCPHCRSSLTCPAGDPALGANPLTRAGSRDRLPRGGRAGANHLERAVAFVRPSPADRNGRQNCEGC